MSLRRYDPFGFSSIFFDDLFGDEEPVPTRRSPFSNTVLMALPRNDNGNDDHNNVLGGNKHPAGGLLQVHEDEKAYSIAIDVPGVKVDEMTMQLEDDNQVLHLSGGRKFQRGDAVTETKFDRRFTIGRNVDTENITANLTNGVLTVTAPKKDPASTNPPSNVIQITEKGDDADPVAPPKE